MKTQFGLSDDLIKQNIKYGEFGVEKESLRVDGSGYLSHTRHPLKEQHNITRDFCENQMELITDVFDNIDDMLSHLEQLQKNVVQTLQQMATGKEFLWPFSNPPYVKGEEDILIAQFEGEHQEKTRYRNYLAKKYGKKKMLYSGIHLNYSFSDEMLREGYRRSGTATEDSYQSYKNYVYLQLAQKVVSYSWLIVYLTAASPVMDASFLECGIEVLMKYASPRCSEIGYWNDFIPVFDYHNLESYIHGIEEYVRSGRLKSVSELYYPVRLKPKSENSLEYLKKYGINHIELRMLDVNPLSPVGLLKEDVEFLHYFLLYLIRLEKVELTEEEQILAIQNEKKAAEFDDTLIFIKASDGSSEPIREAALRILQDMEEFYGAFGEMEVLESIRYQKDKLTIPEHRYADWIRRNFGAGYVKKGVRLAEAYADGLLKK